MSTYTGKNFKEKQKFIVAGKQRTATKQIFVHCSATPETMDIGAKDIDRWHKNRGWAGIGYHIVIRRDGRYELGRKLDTMGAHAYGHNRDSVAICLVGGVDRNNAPEANFTDSQWQTLRLVIEQLQDAYGDIPVRGHNEVSAKACPSFDVKEWWAKQ